MTALEILIDLLKRFEGLRLNAYLCPAGVPTIGYGETLGVKMGDVWTMEQSQDKLKHRAGQFLRATINRCPQLANEPAARQAACASLAYNIGVGAFEASSVSRHTQRREYASAANSFLLWNKGGGKVLPGLTSRRKIERDYFLIGF